MMKSKFVKQSNFGVLKAKVFYNVNYEDVTFSVKNSTVDFKGTFYHRDSILQDKALGKWGLKIRYNSIVQKTRQKAPFSRP